MNANSRQPRTRRVHLGRRTLLLETASMPRIPKPFPWRGGWYTDAGGKRTFLLPRTATFTEAQTALRQLLSEHDQNGGRAYPSLTVAELFALFLDMVEVENEAATY